MLFQKYIHCEVQCVHLSKNKNKHKCKMILVNTFSFVDF